MDSIPGSGRSRGEGNVNPLQYSCLGNPTDRGVWQVTVHGVAKRWTRLSDWALTRLLRLVPVTMRSTQGNSDVLKISLSLAPDPSTNQNWGCDYVTIQQCLSITVAGQWPKQGHVHRAHARLRFACLLQKCWSWRGQLTILLPLRGRAVCSQLNHTLYKYFTFIHHL